MVTRRSFIRAVGAAITVPLIQLRQTVPQENLLLNFCGDDARYKLSQPFAYGGLTYATDNTGMIRTELTNLLEVGEARLPPVEQTWREYWNPYLRWVPLDAAMMQPTITKEWQLCPRCGNERVSYGERYPPYEEIPELVSKHDYDGEDNTLRNRSCELCHGLEYTDAGFSNVCGWPHSTYRLKRIAALPNPMVCRSASRPAAILFRADNFEGISLGWTDDK